MWTKLSTSPKNIAKALDAMQHAFARLREIQAEAEKCRQELKQLDERDKWLLLIDAEYNRIQSEWDKAFTEFHRLATEASDLIIENTRRFGGRIIAQGPRSANDSLNRTAHQTIGNTDGKAAR